ncbi:SRPBCC family protein [Nocardioidaceae bacterium]|nr:SRPBCC family protein [Nocardioidaceae bacterium]
MSSNRRVVDATPDQVWDVLADGWLYPLFVVGATRMREVDDDWPAAGARLHHSVGVWPFVVDDVTEVEECRPGSMLQLRARAWPSGDARVRLHLTPHGSGTELRIEEDVRSGPARLVPSVLRQGPLHWRNHETIRRLRLIVENRRPTS